MSPVMGRCSRLLGTALTMRRCGAVNGSNPGAPISPFGTPNSPTLRTEPSSPGDALVAGDEADDLPGVEPFQKQIPLAGLAPDGRRAERQRPVSLGQERAPRIGEVRAETRGGELERRHSARDTRRRQGALHARPGQGLRLQDHLAVVPDSALGCEPLPVQLRDGRVPRQKEGPHVVSEERHGRGLRLAGVAGAPGLCGGWGAVPQAHGVDRCDHTPQPTLVAGNVEVAREALPQLLPGRTGTALCEDASTGRTGRRQWQRHQLIRRG